MKGRIQTLAAVLMLGASLAACSQPAQAPQQQPPAGGDGGYGPFGGGPAQQQPAPVSAPPPMTGAAEGVIAGAGGDAPAEFHTLITNYLNDYNRQMAQGWPQVQGVPDAVTGLNLNGEHRWQVRLRGGQAYAFIGACDNECSNVDLVLEDGAGAAVDSDVLADDYPLVEVIPPADGVYTLRIQLKSCTMAPCYVGARLVRRP